MHWVLLILNAWTPYIIWILKIEYKVKIISTGYDHHGLEIIRMSESQGSQHKSSNFREFKIILNESQENMMVKLKTKNN